MNSEAALSVVATGAAVLMGACAFVDSRRSVRSLMGALALVVAALAAWRGLDLDDSVRDDFANAARDGGWYGTRRRFQIATVGVGAIALGGMVLFVIARFGGRSRGTTRMLFIFAMLVASAGLVGIELLRVTSLHTADVLLDRRIAGVELDMWVEWTCLTVLLAGGISCLVTDDVAMVPAQVANRQRLEPGSDRHGSSPASSP